MRKFAKFSFLLGALAALAVLSGCAHARQEEELSERPWNAPKSWENGIPGSIMRGQ
jgi:hypothetical protein